MNDIIDVHYDDTNNIETIIVFNDVTRMRTNIIIRANDIVCETFNNDTYDDVTNNAMTTHTINN